jgi:hypothetical protein
MPHFDYNPDSFFQAALAWLKRGCTLIPIQKNSKFILQGFGPFRRVLRTYQDAESYFKIRRYNLAVVLPSSAFCLDFDDFEIFARWSDETPADLQLTQTEATPRGFHLFYKGELPAGLALVQGVEIRRSVVVAPSIVKGRRYFDTGISDRLQEITDINSLIFPLLSEKDPLARIPQPGQAAPVGAGESDLVARIKASFPITELVGEYTELRRSGAEGRWFTGLCPFHRDHRPSLWVDAERGLWGCHACGVRGDVINFFAREHKLTLQGAIRELAGRLERV